MKHVELTPKVLFLNSPARTGKDTLAKYLSEQLPISLRSYAHFPKHGTHASYGLHCIPPDHFESRKDEPCDEFFGLTPRQAYIKHAEVYMKILHGRNVYGAMMAKRLNEARAKHVVITDLGFPEEVEALIPIYGTENMLILHIDRSGYTYENDSRNYVRVRGVENTHIVNLEGSINLMLHTGLMVAKDFFGYRFVEKDDAKAENK